MKHPVKLFFALFLLLFSCSQHMDDEWKPDKLSNGPETQSVGFMLSRASLETFAEYGITEIGIYVYLKDSLVFGKNLPLNDGNLKVDVPLGEKLQTFAVANAGHLEDTDSLSKVVVYQDEQAQKEVFISPIAEFLSDRTVSQVNLELKRAVGQANFQPLETGAEIAAITQFDAMSLVFSNVGIGYKVNTGECVQGNVTVSTGLAAGFQASVYSFSTEGKDLTGVDVIYNKAGVEVNRTKRALDTNITFQVSKRAIVKMPILDESYLKYSFDQVRSMKVKTDISRKLVIEECDF